MFWLFHTFFGRFLLWEIGKLFKLLFFAGKMSNEAARNLSSRPSARQQRAQSLEEAENHRLAGCRQVVLDYLDALGFIARECISRAELEKLIDEGIEPDDLSREIRNRIDKKPGIVLGRYHFANGDVEIKLPFSLRDRHMYIIGRSGSGKTNLIRLMALQDVFYGCGIGIIAPEQELW